MHKKLLLSFLAVTAISGLSAKHLTPQEALSRALSQPTTGMSKAPASAAMVATRTLVTSDNTEAIYLFEGDGGSALVVPADDRVDPVLGYVDGVGDGCLPPQMEWWLSEYVRQIEYVMSFPESGTGLRLTLPAKAAADKAPIAPMISTRWSQDSPYNYNCPTVNGSKSMTGCVATAAAQILKYHRYPAEGTGTISYSDLNSGASRTLSLDGKPFDYDNMLDSYSGAYNTTQRNAVAFIMQAVGFASEMTYSPEASGASSLTMVEGMKKYFGYNEKMELIYRQNFLRDEWEDLIYENLQKVGPIYYAGTDNIQGAHAFVCDGYSSDGFFHFNWGWGGAYDGYFKLSALIPEGQGIGGNYGGFNFGQEIAVNFTRPDAATIDLNALSCMTLEGSLTAEKVSGNRLKISSDQTSYGAAFYNKSNAAVNVELGLKAVNTATGEETFRGEGTKRTINSYYGMLSVNLYIPENLPDGDYRIYLITRDYPDGEWLELTHDIYCSNYVNISVANGIITSVSNVPGSKIEASGLELSTSVYMGYPFKISYTLVNSGQTEIYDGVAPFIFTVTSGGEIDPKGIGDSFVADMDPGQSMEVETVATLYSYTATAFTGEAYLGLRSQNTGALLTYIPVTVKASPAGTLSVSATDFSMVGDRDNADANNLQFNCGLQVSSGYWAAPFTVYICTLSGSLLQNIVSSETYFLNANETVTTTVSGSFPAAEEGKYYEAIFGYVSGNYIQSIASCIFTVATPYSGVEENVADTASRIAVTADRFSGTLSVTAPSAIGSVEVYTLDGRRLSPDVWIDGPRAGASLSALPDGILLVKVILADGTATAAKVVK